MGRRSAFLPPLRTPQNKANEIARIKQIENAFNNAINTSSNNAFNLAVSSCLIACRDMGMDVADVKETLQRTFGILDDIADNLSRIDEVISLVESWGIKIHKDTEKVMMETGKKLNDKATVFSLLENGVTEIEDILAKCKAKGVKIDFRDACAYRWEFNKVKYYKDMEAIMTKKEQFFDLLEQGKSTEEIMKIIGCKSADVYQHRYLYKKMQEDNSMAKNKTKAFNLIQRGASKEDLVKELGITEAAAIRFLDKYREEKNGGEIEVVTEDYKKQALELFDKGYSKSRVRDILSLSDGKAEFLFKEWVKVNKADLSTGEMAEALAENNIASVILRHKGVLPKKEEVKKEAKEEVKKEEIRVDKKVKLNKVVKVVEIQGEFTTYKPVGENSFDMEIDGQVITLSREQMLDFGNELIAVAEEEI